MKMRAALLVMALSAAPLWAEPQVLARATLPVGTIISSADLTASEANVAAIEALLGMETRAIIFEGQPVTLAKLSLPTLLDANAPVTLIYRRGGLAIETEGRALERASAGDIIQVLNLQSRAIISARIGQDGLARAAY